MKSPEKIEEEDVDTQEEMKEVVKEPGAKKKESLPRKRRTVKRQKLEEDAEKEELKGEMAVPRTIRDLSEMLEDLDRQECRRVVKISQKERKIEESLNVTFDETPPPSKTSPLVDDDIDEEEEIKVAKKKILEKNIEDETLEIDEVVNIKESRNHLLENVIENLNERTLRLFAQGYNQQEGIDYDETYASVARLECIKILLAYACALDFKLFQMDVKSAFLNGFINEEVYVAQPPGFIDFKKPDHVYKLKKDLYVLKQAPKACVCLCARFQEAPKTSHLEVVKRIFRYIKGTTHLGLWYPKGTGIETVVYADSDHAGDYVDRKSTSEENKFTASLTKIRDTRYELYGVEEMVENLWSKSLVAYDKDILSIVRSFVDKQQVYGYLQEIVVKRANKKEYILKEAEFLSLYLNDIEDMFLLYYQNKLHHLDGKTQTDLVVAL
ncbi:copia protein [Tanacetum coccineum]